MKLLALTCNHCGAPIEVPRKVKFVTCQFCSTKLQVHTEGNGAYTEVLEQLTQTTDRIADNTEVIRLQNELERIDREWTMQRSNYMIKGKDGEMSVPTKAGTVFSGIFVIIVVGIMFLAMASSPFPAMALFPAGIFIIALFSLGTAMHKADEYDRRKRTHDRRRMDIIRELDQLP